MAKQIFGWFLISLGLPWVGTMLYMLLRLGPHQGWISDEFFHVEAISFMLLPGWIVGPVCGLAVLSSGNKESELT
jgi:hypothetical protein